MCTVSIIPLYVAGATGFRLVSNRDELRTRPEALPPAVRRFGEHRATMPIDPVSNGTWVAASDAGMAMALLNVNSLHRAFAESPRLSRGVIIPHLLASDAARDALRAAQQLDPGDFPPFRLIVIDRDAWGEVFSDGWDLRTTVRPFDGKPLIFTSSGLGDALVEGPRRMLFDRLIRTADVCPRRQDEFHDHQWPDRPQVSVRMSRADASTVSRTTIEMIDGRPTMRYVAWASRPSELPRLQPA